MVVRLPTHICVTRPQWVKQPTLPHPVAKLRKIQIYFIVSSKQLSTWRFDNMYYFPPNMWKQVFEMTKLHCTRKSQTHGTTANQILICSDPMRHYTWYSFARLVKRLDLLCQATYSAGFTLVNKAAARKVSVLYVGVVLWSIIYWNDFILDTFVSHCVSIMNRWSPPWLINVVCFNGCGLVGGRGQYNSADVLAPRGARTSVAMVLTVYDKRTPFFHESGFHLNVQF